MFQYPRVRRTVNGRSASKAALLVEVRTAVLAAAIVVEIAGSDAHRV
jgi:hypothetical protein